MHFIDSFPPGRAHFVKRDKEEEGKGNFSIKLNPREKLGHTFIKIMCTSCSGRDRAWPSVALGQNSHSPRTRQVQFRMALDHAVTPSPTPRTTAHSSQSLPSSRGTASTLPPAEQGETTRPGRLQRGGGKSKNKVLVLHL